MRKPTHKQENLVLNENLMRGPTTYWGDLQFNNKMHNLMRGPTV